MRKRIEYYWLILSGIALVIMSVYMQWISMELNTYSIAEYIASDLNQWIWWKAIGIPFLVGCAYLGIAGIGIRMNSNFKATLVIFICCFVIGIFLSIVSGLGYLAVYFMAMSLIYLAYVRKKRSASHFKSIGSE